MSDLLEELTVIPTIIWWLQNLGTDFQKIKEERRNLLCEDLSSS